jgi:hypothetical protein
MIRTRRASGIIPVAFSFAIISLISPLAVSQTMTTADASGVVSDTSGAVVPGASVTIKSVQTGESRTETTNGQGQYKFPLLKPGDFLISASAKGLKSNIQKISILLGQDLEINLKMNPEGANQVVEVSTQGELLNTENANLETSFSNKQVQELPMAGGDLTTLAMTVPGIRVNVTGGSSNMNANGIPGASILFTLDGMDQNDPANNINNSGASNNLLGANGVSEAAVIMNAYSPQYGRMAGAQVNMVGISGSNQFHGNLFYNYNWQDLNANSFFNNATNTRRGRSDAHQFGGRVGGPVWKNKLFFFFDDENLRYVLPAAGVVSLPSPQLLAYALAHVPAAAVPLYKDMANLISTSPGIGRAVPVTNGTGLLQDNSAQPGGHHGDLGCGTGSLSPYSKYGATPDGSGGTFGITTPCAVALGTNNTQLNTERQYTIRMDYNINNNNKVSFRFNNDTGIQATGTSPINPAFNALSVQPSYQGSVNVNSVITPNIVNNFVGSVLWYSALFGVADFTKTTSLMPEAIALGDGGANGGGFPTVGGATYPYGFPAGRNVGHIQFNDDISWTKGRHTLKAGIAYRYDKYTYSSIAQSAFIGQYNISDLADFANGKLNYSGANLGSSFAQSFPLYGALHFRFPSADFYGSDEWAVTKDLKITFGLRFEKDQNPTCNEKCFVLTNVPFDSPAYQGGASIPYNSTITKSSNLFYHAEGVIIQPRVGVAYKPFADGKTVIRGGIGIFSTNYTDGIGGTLANQIPNKFAPSGLTTGNIGLATDTSTSASTAQSSANAFFSGFNAGYTLAQINATLAPIKFSTPSITSIPNTYLAPKDLEWNIEIEHQFTAHNVFSINYVGNHGYNLAETVNANMYTSAAGAATYGGTYGGLPTVAPDSRFVTVTQYYNNGVSNYNGLTLQYRHSFSYGLTGQLHYTWSHALGTVAFENPFNINSGYGSLGFDNRHQMAGDLVWIQPHRFDNKIVNALTSDWTLGTKLYLYSGAPFSITDSKIPSQVNSAGGVLTPLADLLVPSAVNANCGSASVNTPCLTKSEFATYNPTLSGVSTAMQTDWGNIAPNSFRGPGYFDIDMQVSRNFRIKEKMILTLGIQAYNLLNHTNFANPTTASQSVSSGSFAQITTTLGPPTSIYGTGQGASVSGRLAVLSGRFTF